MGRIEGNTQRKGIDQVQVPIEGVGRQATPIEGESEADRARPTKSIAEKTGIFITRRHWEKEKRKRPVKSFDRIGKAELVEVGPQPSKGKRKGLLVNRPYLKQGTLKDSKRNQVSTLMVLVKPHMTSVFPVVELPKRPKKRLQTPRGKITSFSRKSRARLMREMLGLERLPDSFSTLTYDDTVIESLLELSGGKSSSAILNEKIHADIHRLNAFIKKYFPKTWFFWRVEWKERKYGKLKGLVVPHWHGLWGGPVPFEALKQIVLKKWLDYTGTKNPDAFAVTYKSKSFIKLDNNKQIFFYVSKYTAKASESMGFETGRHWGSVGPVPLAKGIAIEVDSCEAKHFMRVLRRWIKARTQKRGAANYIKKTLYRGTNAYIYIEDIDMGISLEFAAEWGEIPF